jgi:hypothetical protein
MGIILPAVALSAVASVVLYLTRARMKFGRQRSLMWS